MEERGGMSSALQLVSRYCLYPGLPACMNLFYKPNLLPALSNLARVSIGSNRFLKREVGILGFGEKIQLDRTGYSAKYRGEKCLRASPPLG